MKKHSKIIREVLPPPHPVPSLPAHTDSPKPSLTQPNLELWAQPRALLSGRLLAQGVKPAGPSEEPGCWLSASHPPWRFWWSQQQFGYLPGTWLPSGMQLLGSTDWQEDTGQHKHRRTRCVGQPDTGTVKRWAQAAARGFIMPVHVIPHPSQRPPRVFPAVEFEGSSSLCCS